ncbi:MAG TPA: DNA topoisomerase IB, partial [Agrococcus sp.]|nr:DNA topoisomerase IB [Agrococcus sp.]
MTRLRRAHPGSDAGIRRRRSGRGWSYAHDGGRRVSAADRERAESLVVPPAWKDVWIAADPLAHIQAIGV